MSPVALRPATSHDVDAVVRCVDAAYRPYLDRMPVAPAPLLDDYDALIERGVVTVAISQDEIVGLIVMWAEPDHVFIDNIAVSPQAQGRGLGRRLIDLAVEQARAVGHTELRLYTNEAMTENLTYYPRLGFVETHRAFGNGYDRVYFSRML
ncbi:MAG: GNAT family N-acetyltransferase [Actinomycetota bacterium]